MRWIDNNYVRAGMLLALILITISFTGVSNVIIKSTGKVIDTSATEKALFVCNFEDSLTCSNSNPTKTRGIEFVEGKEGNGVFIGADDVLEYPAEGNFDSSKGSMEFWVKPSWDSMSEGAHRFFYINYPGWTFWVGSEYFNYHIYFHVKSANIPYGIYKWKADTWHYITITWDRLETRLYIDGVYQSKDAYYTPAGHPSKIYLGSESTETNQADAVIDEFKIYNYVRTPKQIMESFESYQPEETPVPEEPAPLPQEEGPIAEPIPEPEPVPEPIPEPIEPAPAPSKNNLTFLWGLIILLLVVIVFLLIKIDKWKKKK